MIGSTAAGGALHGFVRDLGPDHSATVITTVRRHGIDSSLSGYSRCISCLIC